MPNFEWDANKNEKNKTKHKVDFEDAKTVFDDVNRLQYIDQTRGERRYITIGKVFMIIMTVVYTTRGIVLRLISARRSSKAERNAYIANKLSKQDEKFK